MLKTGPIWRKQKPNTPAHRWIVARKLFQYASLVIFVYLFLITPQQVGTPGLINLPMRLDPLVAITHLFSSRVFLYGTAISISVILLTVVFGRAWCGWICPLGTILDLFTFNHGWKNPALDASNDKNWRKLKYSLLIAILVAALLGNLTLLVFDPLTILYRTLAASLWPALDQVVTALETSLVDIPLFEGPVVLIDSWIRPSIFPVIPAYSTTSVIFFLVFISIIALNYFTPRFWCRYLCPLGGLLGLVSKAAIFRRQVSQDCKGCKLCERVCPTGTIDSQRNYTSDPSECTLCMDCLDVCPRSSIEFLPTRKLAEWREYDPGRRQVFEAFGLTVAGLAVLSVNSSQKNPPPHLIRPPGANEDDFLDHCIRCAECMRTCPTNALHPAIQESGLIGLWSPILIPRLGYCDYSCNRCGQICPTQAIPPMSLVVKRNQVIGKAYIDENRCIAWADHQDCIVCEEMCPLPEKAITIKIGRWSDLDGEILNVKLPRVDRQICIGCGICENKCPVIGEAAIRVYTTS